MQTRRITVHRRFGSLDEAWEVSRKGASTSRVLSGLDGRKVAEVQARFADQFRPESDGSVVMTATAVAVRGRRPSES